MWWPEIPIDEKMLRAGVVYLFILLMFRLTGKRQVGQLTPFDLVVLLIVSNVLQNAMIGPDNSLLGGILGALVIFALNGIVARLSFMSRRIERLLQGEATVLVHDGELREDALRRELVTHEDLHAALREAGMVNIHEARFAVLEATGRISAGPRHRHEHAASATGGAQT